MCKDLILHTSTCRIIQGHHTGLIYMRFQSLKQTRVISPYSHITSDNSNFLAQQYLNIEQNLSERKSI